MYTPDKVFTQADVRSARQLVLPASIMPFLAEALEADPPVPVERPRISLSTLHDIDDLNAFPAITSVHAILKAGTIALEKSATISDKLTEPQTELLYRRVDQAAMSPDHHFKHNSMTTYAQFALAFIHEGAYAGEIQAPQTAGQVVEALEAMEYHPMMREGMMNASGNWAQVAYTTPAEIFKVFRDLYKYGRETPWVYDDDGIPTLKPAIIAKMHANMRERNQGGKLAAAGCPLAIEALHQISSDPESSRHLSEEQIQRLLAARPDGSPAIATQDERGSLHMRFDPLPGLKKYFLNYAHGYIERFGVPEFTEIRDWQHNSSYRIVGKDSVIGPSSHADPKEDCPQSEPHVWGYTNKSPCICHGNAQAA